MVSRTEMEKLPQFGPGGVEPFVNLSLLSWITCSRSGFDVNGAWLVLAALSVAAAFLPGGDRSRGKALVGIAVRALGQGVDKSFSRVGAGLALVGCLLGTCMHGCILLAQTEGVALLTVLTHLRLEAIDGLMITTFQPWDWGFYGVAVILAYRFSRGRIKRAKTAAAA